MERHDSEALVYLMLTLASLPLLVALPLLLVLLLALQPLPTPPLAPPCRRCRPPTAGRRTSHVVVGLLPLLS